MPADSHAVPGAATEPPAVPGAGRDRRFLLALGSILVVGLALRVLYTLAQSVVDPWFAHPVIDGRYYVDWARALVEGGATPPGAYYLAPLYPYFLAALFRVVGESFGWLYLAQHVLAVGSAGLIAWGGRRAVGETGALFGAALFLLHQPLWFFAARPLGETLAIFLLVGGLAAAWREGARAALLAGLLAGLAALARPNLLLVPVLWGLGEAARRRWPRLALLVAGLAIAVLPVTVRNWVVSGHLVPVSSNGGMTAYHGNGPGAVGIYTHPAGFSLDLSQQREEATRHARARSGLPLDAVEADSWWGRQALETRLRHPAGSAGLIAWRIALTVGNREFGLDYPPTLDPNPWRPTVRLPGGREISWVPWALLLGLAAAGVTLDGFRRTGAWPLWGALAACAVTPVLFYVSSRYRLPTAALLTVPAGAGLAGLLRSSASTSRRRRTALAAGALVAAISLAVPSGDLYRLQTAESLANRAQAYLVAGKLALAEADARDAIDLQPNSPRLWVNLGAVLIAGGRFDEAQSAYRRALEIDPASPGAARGLASALARSGRVDAALRVLRRALTFEPRDVDCWNGLVTLLYAAGDAATARSEAARAAQAGVRLDPRVLSAISYDPAGTDGQRNEP